MMLTNYTPGKPLLKAIRAALILKDGSLSSWADENGVKRQNLTKAITGEWTGPKASKLLNHVLADTLGHEQK